MRTRFSRSEAESPGADRVDGDGRDARIVAELSARALLNNYHAIRELVPGQGILPMIKADAYGHGAAWAARALVGEPGLYGFGVATLEEGAALRKALDETPRKLRASILVVSGTTPWTEEKGRFCEKHALTASICTDDDWQAFVSGGWTERVAYELKFNTGMNRLGISAGLARPIVRKLATIGKTGVRGGGSVHHPRGVFSHLAMGESPDAKLSQRQRELFAGIRSEFAGALPAAHFHIANSAAIWNQKQWGLDGLTDVVRPGIALYGAPPWVGAPERGLEPVMRLRARVIAVHRLKRGDSVGYGATYKVTEDEPVFVATLSAGYADGVHRALSNRGHAWLEGGAVRMIGIVSMDLCAINCSAKTRVGEWAELLGPRVDVWAQAQAASTIPYELFTSVSPRVKRIYE